MNKYLIVFVSIIALQGMEFEESHPKAQLRSAIIAESNIIEGIKKGDIDLLPFRSFNRADFLNLIVEFNLERSLFLRWQDFVDNYTVLIWQDLSCYPLKNKDKFKLPTLMEMEESIPSSQQLFLSMGINIENNIMDQVLSFAALDDFKEIENKFLQNYSNIVSIIKWLSYFGCEGPAKVCAYLFCKKQKGMKKLMPPHIRNILISETDLKNWGKLPEIKEQLLNQYIPIPIRLREKFNERVKVLNLNNSCVSMVKSSQDAQVLLLKNNNLKSIGMLPQNMDQVLILDISYNNFSFNDWDINMPELILLNVAHNQITELEAGWARNLKDLIFLDLSNNKLGNNIFVSGWTWGFEGYLDKEGVSRGGLTWLNLANNGIKILHKGWAKGLKRLKILNLSSNPLEKLDKGWSQGLDGLELLIIPKNIKSELKEQINWELNTIPAFLFGRQPVERVKIVEK